MRRAALLIGVLVFAGCGHKVPPPSAELIAQFQGKELYTCCNIRYQEDTITDANYSSGTMIPLGTPVTVVPVAANAVTFDTGGQRITLRHVYGAKEETHEQYFGKIFIPKDTKALVAKWSKSVQAAVREGRVQPGMTRQQVVLSLGFPPTDDNPQPKSPEWTYWFGKGQSFKVTFDEDGIVTNVIGRPAPTRDKVR